MPTETAEVEPSNGVRAEAMCHVIALFGDLTERERNIAEAAARSAYRWTLREIVEDCEIKLTSGKAETP
jgi:hypothetical protein